MSKTPKRAVIVHGPAGSGKTTNKAALKKLYGTAKVVDEWDGQSVVEPNTLYLTRLKGTGDDPENPASAGDLVSIRSNGCAMEFVPIASALAELEA